MVQAVKKRLPTPAGGCAPPQRKWRAKWSFPNSAADLKPLIEDPDGFVVKSALESLTKFNSAPEPEQLVEVARRLPGLRLQAIQQLVGMSSAPAVKAVTELYASGPNETRKPILQSIGLTASASPRPIGSAAIRLEAAAGQGGRRTRTRPAPVGSLGSRVPRPAGDRLPSFPGCCPTRTPECGRQRRAR